MERVHHRVDPVAVRSHTGAHGVHALHGGTDRHLGPGTGLPGDVADLHLPVGNFGSLQLKQAPDQIRMGPGDLNLRAPPRLMHLQHVDPDHFAGGVALAGDLLAAAQHRLGGVAALSDLHEHVAGEGIDPGHGSGQQLLRLVGVGFVHDAPLGFPDALNDHLLGGLGGDPAELGDVHGDIHRVAHLHVGVIAPGGVDLDLQRNILRLLHGGLDQVHGQPMLVKIHHHVVRGHVLVILPVLPVGIGERLLQPLHHIVNGNALDLLQIPQAGEDLRADVHLWGLCLFLTSGISGHDVVHSSCQNSTRSRTSATWDFSKVTVCLFISTVTRPSS